MTRMRRPLLTLLGVVTGTVLVAGCTGEPATYDEKNAYLRTVALRGAEQHAFLTSQETKIDRARCDAVFKGLINDIPNDSTSDSFATEPWYEQVQAYFVDSCVSGKPKPVPGDATSPAPRSTVPATTSATTPPPG